MGSYFSTLRPGGKMHSAVLAALLSVAAAAPQLPAGLSAAACPNYPFCGAVAPADFPVPVVNGEPVAPVLNTVPAQTRFYQNFDFDFFDYYYKNKNFFYDFFDFFYKNKQYFK